MAGRRQAVNIRDVARRANSSPATVSRVLSRSGYPVGNEKRLAIERAASELGYQPVSRQQRTNGDEIAVILPDLGNPFYAQAMLGIQQAAEERGCAVLICDTLGDPVREQQCLRRFYDRGLRAAILSPASEDAQALRSLIRKGMTLVLLDQVLEGLDCPGIRFDVYSGVRLALRHLIDNGHRQIALATTPLTRWSRRQVHQAYRDELSDQGLFDPDLIFVAAEQNARPNLESRDLAAGAELGVRMADLTARFSAVLAVNDSVACGLMRHFRRQGLRIPDDVSILGIDDVPTAALVTPALSTVAFPTYEAGRLAVSLLFNAWSGHSRIPLRANLETQLVLRETVRPLSTDR